MRLSLPILVVTICLNSSVHVAAVDRKIDHALKAFDELCVATHLDRKAFDARVGLLENAKISKDMLANMPPGNDVAYWLQIEGTLIAAMLGKRKFADDNEIGVCTITVKQLSFSAVSEMLVSNFPARKIDHFKQGLSEVALYRTSLAGYQEVMVLGIQVGSGIASISIFEMPAP